MFFLKEKVISVYYLKLSRYDPSNTLGRNKVVFKSCCDINLASSGFAG